MLLPSTLQCSTSMLFAQGMAPYEYTILRAMSRTQLIRHVGKLDAVCGLLSCSSAERTILVGFSELTSSVEASCEAGLPITVHAPCDCCNV